MSRVVSALGLFGLGILLAAVAMIPMLTDVFAPVTPIATDRVVEVEAEGRRMLWVRASDPTTTCEVTDETGTTLTLHEVGRLRMDSEHGYLRGTGRYDAPGGTVSIDCDGDATTYESMAFDSRWMLDRLLPVFVPFLALSVLAGLVLLLEVRRGRRLATQE
jgi:hypothetical protein